MVKRVVDSNPGGRRNCLWVVCNSQKIFRMRFHDFLMMVSMAKFGLTQRTVNPPLMGSNPIAHILLS